MIQHKNQDMFLGGSDVIVHQVNCQGTMGSGVARQVREFFPDVYKKYRDVCSSHIRFGDKILGEAQFIETVFNDRHIVVVNAFAQEKYGYGGIVYTDYTALNSCLYRIKQYVKYEQTMYQKIGIPYLMGCDRGGGDWNIVYPMICDILSDCNVTIYHLK